MPRKSNTVTILAWPKLRRRRRYTAKVKTIKLQRASSCLHVTLENLDPTQKGRLHELDLPVPIRPGNKTCRFLTACGVDATEVGATIDLDQLVNRVVGFRPHGHDTEQLEFEQISNASASETTASETDNSKTERYASEGTGVNGRNDPRTY